jgi:glycosyltransferase involved in cell wall biosynthesis
MNIESKLSFYVLTHNSSQYLAEILSAVSMVADELIVVDSGSVDETRHIAEGFGCTWLARTFDNFLNQRRFAVDHCTFSWVLTLDSDEVPDQEFVTALQAMKEGGFDLDGHLHDAYSVRREWTVLGRNVPCMYPVTCPDYPLRLFNKARVGYGAMGQGVHESLSGHATAGRLRGTVRHITCSTYEELYQKLNCYTTLAAQDVMARGKYVSPVLVVGRGVIAFLKYYLLKGGFLHGLVGFALAKYAFDYTFLKYAKAHYVGYKTVHSPK